MEIQSGTVRVKELEDGSMAYVWEALLEPCKRKGKLLRMTRVDGKQGVYAVYAEDDLAGVGQRHQPGGAGGDAADAAGNLLSIYI